MSQKPIWLDGEDPLDDLALRAKTGDGEALRQLLMELKEPVWRWVHRILGSAAVGSLSGEDLSQEALTRLWQKLKQHDSSRPFRPWAARVVRNLVLDKVRGKAGKQEKRELALEQDFLPDGSAPKPDAFDLERSGLN